MKTYINNIHIQKDSYIDKNQKGGIGVYFLIKNKVEKRYMNLYSESCVDRMHIFIFKLKLYVCGVQAVQTERMHKCRNRLEYFAKRFMSTHAHTHTKSQINAHRSPSLTHSLSLDVISKGDLCTLAGEFMRGSFSDRGAS